MDVGRERERGRVMPEPHLNLLRVQAATKEDRCARMAERVEADPRHARALRGGLQDTPPEVRRVEPLAGRRRERECVGFDRSSRLTREPKVTKESRRERDAPHAVLRLRQTV